MWRNGVEMAAQDINASGGLLGQLVEVTTYDTQSHAAGAHAAAGRGIDAGTYAVLGPVEPTTAHAVASVAAERRVAMLTGADLDDLAPTTAAFVFRTDLSLATRLARLADYLRAEVRPKRVGLVWSAAEAGQTVRDAFTQAARTRGLDIVVNLAVDAHGATLASDAAKLAAERVDAVFVGLNEAESTYFVAEMRRHAASVVLFGESALISQPGIDRLGPEANGLIAHVGPEYAVDVPSLRAFHERFSTRFAVPPDRGAIAGYVAVAAVKAFSTTLGRVDRASLPDALRRMTITTRMEPSILLDSRWDANGYLDRDSFIVEVRDQKPRLASRLAMSAG